MEIPTEVPHPTNDQTPPTYVPAEDKSSGDDGDDLIEQIVNGERVNEGGEAAVEKDAEKAKQCKQKGNDEYKAGQLEEAVRSYTQAVALCPDTEESKKDLAIYHCNRAACYVMLEQYDSAVKDCSVAIDLNPGYLNAYLRRGRAYVVLIALTDKLDEKVRNSRSALEDMQKVLELNPQHTEAREETQKLEAEEKKLLEQQKDEMLGKLKDLGNGILGKFGLNLNNFKTVQDPKTGGYSVNFQK